VKTKQQTRSKSTAKKKSTTAKKQKRSNGTLTNQQIKDRTICNGNVVLFQRENSKRWQCRIRRNTGTWIDYSTKQTDLKKAKKVAEERYESIKYRQEHGLIDVTRRFSDVCKLARKELLAEYEDTERILAKQLVQVIDKYLIPLLGNYQCHNIKTEQLREFSKKRVELMGKVPTTSTIATHNTALNYVFRKALSLNYIQYLPRLISNDGDSTKKRRSYFDDTEMRQLINGMTAWVKTTEALHKVKGGRNGIDTLSDSSYDIRMMLRDVVLILVNTGIRVGEELINLKWNNLDIVEQDGMESIRFSLTHTKTRIQRVVIGYEPIRKNEDERYGCWMPLQRIAERFPKLGEMDWDKLFQVDEYIFRLPSSGKVVRQEALTKNFKKLLLSCKTKQKKKEGLLRDDFGNARVLYSLRHTYASRRRYEGMSFDNLSVQMGTSVKMLEEHYSHFSVSDNPNLFSGHAKRQQTNKDKEIEELKKQIEELKKQNEKKTYTEQAREYAAVRES
tara:strand:+ start:351 stop:1862 length:1512 start_codon:yes stop_codon:yes gene_type:complete